MLESASYTLEVHHKLQNVFLISDSVHSINRDIRGHPTGDKCSHRLPNQQEVLLSSSFGETLCESAYAEQHLPHEGFQDVLVSVNN